MSRSLSVVSLFAGVGGIDLAAQRAGMNTRLVCEIDKPCRSVLARRFPEAAIHDDVRTLTADDLRAAGAVPDRTVLTAGWPCQGNSVAGRREGMADARSGLWSEVARLLAEFRPRWFLGENVPGLLSVNGGRDFGSVIRDMGELGYGFAWRVLDAQYFGVPQRRERVVVVGHLGGTGATSAEVLLEPEGGGRDHPPRREEGQAVAGTLGGGSGNRGWSPDTDRMTFVPVAFSENQRGEVVTKPIADSLKTGGGKPGQGYPAIAFAWQAGGNDSASGAFKDDGTTPTLPRSQTLAVLEPDMEARRLTPLECERLQGFPDCWTEEQSDAARYKEMGNSVAVPVFTWTLRRLAAVDAALGEVAA